MLLIEAFSKSSATLFLLIDAHYCHISKRCKETQKEEMLELLDILRSLDALGTQEEALIFLFCLFQCKEEKEQREKYLGYFCPRTFCATLCQVVT